MKRIKDLQINKTPVKDNMRNRLQKKIEGRKLEGHQKTLSDGT